MGSDSDNNCSAISVGAEPGPRLQISFVSSDVCVCVCVCACVCSRRVQHESTRTRILAPSLSSWQAAAHSYLPLRAQRTQFRVEESKVESRKGFDALAGTT
ncbi:uncharacterized protein Dvir_GJ27154 [Drosophila virilis]|uniref:Uncharacterized protein n=1 Tax=Drosophila virilis TaxID=7244 RepID=A0A0Q9VYZ0_DROVI|nr:uncharacterized protein Dvir_GJ27154 [Drosophila virilis]